MTLVICSSRYWLQACGAVQLTYAEYRGIFDKDKALSRRFQKVDVPEPSVEEVTEG